MSFYSEFNGIKEIAIDGETYVSKKELLDLIRGEQKRYREGKEGGYLNLSKKQTISVDLALNHLKVLLCKRFYDELREEMFKYIIAGSSDETGTLVYLTHWCRNVPGQEGKDIPVFGEDPNEAMRYESRENAANDISEIHEKWPGMDIGPVQVGWTHTEEGLKRIHSFLGWPEGREMEDVLREELSWRKKPE